MPVDTMRYIEDVLILYVSWARSSFSGFPEHVKIERPTLQWSSRWNEQKYVLPINICYIIYICMEKSAETLRRMMFRPTTPWFHCCSFRPGPKCWMDLIESMSRPGPCWKMRWAQDGFPETGGAKELQSLWNQGSRWCCQRHLFAEVLAFSLGERFDHIWHQDFGESQDFA